MVPAVQPSLLVQPSPGKKFKIETVSDNIVMVPVSHRKFIWAPVLDSLAETPATPPPPSSPPPSVGFIYDGAIGQKCDKVIAHKKTLI
jgi:hypothetical protein